MAARRKKAAKKKPAQKKPAKKRTAKEGKRGLVAGRFDGGLHWALDRINRSFDVDRRLYGHDIDGSIAHATMLGVCGIIPRAAARRIVRGLKQVFEEFDNGTFQAQRDDEDIHMAVERRLTELIGPDGARLHTARSRNDQVALDMRLHTADVAIRTQIYVQALQRTLVERAAEHTETLVPFYTHLQRAQPVVFGHVLLAYVEMLEPDVRELWGHAVPDECPLGAAAGAGTPFPIDRRFTSDFLGFKRPSPNSLEAVSSRRHVTALVSTLACLATTLSRLGGDLVLWTSREFGFARLDDAVSTGSSIMPQKRNPDGAELLRAKATRVHGALHRLHEIQRGLPLGYFKDLQEDKAALFEAQDAVFEMLCIADAMMNHVTFDVERMRAAATDPAGFLLATDAADWLVEQGVPFRDAHAAVGQLVRTAEARGVALQDLPLEDFRAAHPKYTEAVRKGLDPDRALARRRALGGPAPANVRRQVARWRKRLVDAVRLP